MILILSNESEFSTDKVIDWLKYYNQKFIRISSESTYTIDKLFITNLKQNDNVELCFDILNDNVKLNLVNVKSVWFRRGSLELMKLKEINEQILGFNYIKHYLNVECKFISEYLYLFLNTKFKINKVQDNLTNKLNNLNLARKAGFDIPNTLITQNKSDLKEFYFFNNENIIYKSFFMGYLFDKLNNKEIDLPTQKVDYKDFEINPETFFPTFFQENIDKKYEIRVFYIYGEIYATGIFSQNDEMTKIDFRNYNFKRPNRTPVIQIPEKIKISLINFMNEININCGSIDIIYTNDNRYVFLEVNPIGQYDQVSRVANFYLDEIIAKSLMLHNKLII